MKQCLQYALPPVWVLEVTLTPDRHTVQAWRCRHGHGPESVEYEPETFTGNVVVVTVSGHGTISKPAVSELAERIRSDARTFVWSERNGQLFFVRRERLRPLLDALTDADIFPQHIVVAATPDEAIRLMVSSLEWRSFIRPSNECSALMQAIVVRAGLPALVGVLLLLAANAVVFPVLQTRRQELRTALAARERAGTENAAKDARQWELLTNFAGHPVVSRSVICDRIAASVPEAVTLTDLEIEPLIGHLEFGKPLLRNEHIVIVHGIAAEAGAISAFVERLTAQQFLSDIRIARVEREREGDRLSFYIEIKL